MLPPTGKILGDSIIGLTDSYIAKHFDWNRKLLSLSSSSSSPCENNGKKKNLHQVEDGDDDDNNDDDNDDDDDDKIWVCSGTIKTLLCEERFCLSSLEWNSNWKNLFKECST